MSAHLDEISIEHLEAELRRRAEAHASHVCDYCGRPGNTEPCRFLKRHIAASEPAFDPKLAAEAMAEYRAGNYLTTAEYLKTLRPRVTFDEAVAALGYDQTPFTVASRGGQILVSADDLEIDTHDQLRALLDVATGKVFSGEKPTCSHPINCVGKVHENDEPHCLWCGDLTDLSFVLTNLAKVYDHVTGGLISKPMTPADVVIAHADDAENKRAEKALQEIKDEVHKIANGLRLVPLNDEGRQILIEALTEIYK